MVRALSCANCGAPLDIPDGLRYVTCEFCQSRLQVRESGGVSYTELLEKMDRRSQAMRRDLSELQRTRELKRLDRAWEEELESFANEDTGKIVIPEVHGIIAVLLMLCGTGLLMFTLAVKEHYHVGGMILGAVMILGGIHTARQMYDKRRSYLQAKQRFLDKRKRLQG